MKWKSLTLDDFEGHWQLVRSAIEATAALLVQTNSPSSVFIHDTRNRLQSVNQPTVALTAKLLIFQFYNTIFALEKMTDKAVGLM